MAPAAVIFDLGGVVFESPVASLRKLEHEHGMPTNLLNKHIAQSEAWSRMERGLITATQFAASYDAELAAATTNKALRAVSGETVIATIMSSTSVPRPSYVEAIRSLRTMGVKTAALTNNFQPPAGQKEASAVDSVFDVMVESSVVGLRKPDPRIYLLVCDKLGVRPDQCVFLDDIGANLKSAKQVGMAGTVFVRKGAWTCWTCMVCAGRHGDYPCGRRRRGWLASPA
jgi:putative hydrolase of the HAD superfamily